MMEFGMIADLSFVQPTELLMLWPMVWKEMSAKINSSISPWLLHVDQDSPLKFPRNYKTIKKLLYYYQRTYSLFSLLVSSQWKT